MTEKINAKDSTPKFKNSHKKNGTHLMDSVFYFYLILNLIKEFSNRNMRRTNDL